MKMLVLSLLLLSFNVLSMSANYITSEVTATTTSTKVLDKDEGRCAFFIQNKGSQDVWVKMVSAHSGSEGVLIVPGGNWSPESAPRDAVYVKSSASTSAIVVADGHCF